MADTKLQQLVINVGTKAQIEAGIAGGTITQDMLSVATDGDTYIQGVKVNGTELTPDQDSKVNIDLSNYATQTWVGQQGYITGITSAMVTTALGYSPVNPTSLATVATSGSYNDLSNKPTIPTVNNPTITITQGGVTKGSFTLNQSTGDTIALDAGGGGGSVDIDGISITKNGDNELQTVGVIDQNNTSSAIKTWTGTKAQYDAIVSKDANTLYNITDDANPTLSLLESIYPVGSVYIGTMSVCPLSALFGTWTLVSTKILTDIPATLEAKGNGITLGLTNGSSDVGLYYSSGVVMRSAAYGQNIGYAGGSNTNPGTSSLGVTTDSTKSGIVADTNATALTVNVWQRTE